MILGDDALIDVTYSNKLLFRDSFSNKVAEFIYIKASVIFKQILKRGTYPFPLRLYNAITSETFYAATRLRNCFFD